MNGKSAGIQIIAPYRYDLTKLCDPGKNKLIIEVATTLERERMCKSNRSFTGITGEIKLYSTAESYRND